VTPDNEHNLRNIIANFSGAVEILVSTAHIDKTPIEDLRNELTKVCITYLRRSAEIEDENSIIRTSQHIGSNVRSTIA
jgi:hypothetical protein